LGLCNTPEEAIRIVLAVAAGELPEDELADWFRERLAKD
jgi:prophage maintenance system killer protein